MGRETWDNEARKGHVGLLKGEFGALERTRTSDPQLRKLMLYPLSYERARLPDLAGVRFYQNLPLDTGRIRGRAFGY